MPHFMAFDHLPLGNYTAAASLCVGDGGAVAANLYGGNDTFMSIVNGAGSLGRQTMRTRGNIWLNADDPSLLVIGFRLYLDAGFNYGDSNSPRLIGVMNSTNTEYVSFRGVSTGSPNAAISILGSMTGSTPVALPLATWMYIELAVKLSTSADGWVVVKIDGVEIDRRTGVVTASETPNASRCYFGSWASTNTNFRGEFTDCYSKTADDDVDLPGFYGPIVMRHLLPTSDITTEWTPSAGTDHYALVDEAQANSDTDYISTTTPGAKDLFGLGDLPAGVNSVIALVVGTVGKAPDGGAPLVSHVVDIGGTSNEPAGKALGYKYGTQMTAHVLQPNGTAWSESAVNSARIGVKAA